MLNSGKGIILHMLNYCSVNMLFKLMYCNDIEASFLIAPNYYFFFTDIFFETIHTTTTTY